MLWSHAMVMDHWPLHPCNADTARSNRFPPAQAAFHKRGDYTSTRYYNSCIRPCVATPERTCRWCPFWRDIPGSQILHIDTRPSQQPKNTPPPGTSISPWQASNNAGPHMNGTQWPYTWWCTLCQQTDYALLTKCDMIASVAVQQSNVTGGRPRRVPCLPGGQQPGWIESYSSTWVSKLT